MEYRKEVMNDVFTKHHITIEGSYFLLHQFTGLEGGDPHDHPWGFTSHILKGEIIEEVYHPMGATWASELIHHKPGTSYTVDAIHIHRIVELPQGECWTYVIPFKEERKSRFWRFSNNGIESRAWDEKEFTPYNTQL